MSLYVNEIDPFAAAWCRELMAAGCVPHGVVDERSIADVKATDVVGYRRYHWFAGILGWELALQLAGFPRDRECWTGSAPCQPYSSAGNRKGNADERELWPEFARLIRECRPQCVFGEQVSAAIRYGWLDRVHDDLEPEGYTVGACVLTAAGVGAPHLRQRLYWVAHCDRERLARGPEPDSGAQQPGQQTSRRVDAVRCGADGAGREMAHTGQVERRPAGEHRPDRGRAAERGEEATDAERRGGDADEGRRAEGDAVSRRAATGVGVPVPTARGVVYPASNGREQGRAEPDGRSAAGGCLAVWDHWRDAIGIDCRDGKRRRVPAQRGVQCVADGLPAVLGRSGVPCAARYPLAGKSPNRAARLRGYGNAICVQTAALFVRAFLESEGG